MKKMMILILAFSFIGCAKYARIEHASLNTTIQLEKSQYEIVGDITGEASVPYLLIFALGMKTNFGGLEYPFGIMRYRHPVEQNAIFNAIKSHPGVDAIMTPRFETEITGLPPLFWNIKVKVTGKGIKIKEG